ncbi:MAG TPA: aminotransferase class V-fold PLP-dependent enzyme [Candidatus Limnocylindria bacterium]|nr:aminotransferase class V-fold PLP-dependent enzyme [Candidatus Limnocylindria bacterium]
MSVHRGRSFLQIPGPTNVPERILRAMDRAVVDHRGPEFAALVTTILPDLRRVFKAATASVVIYPSSGTGAWEAALVNTLAPGERVIAFDIGHFSALFTRTARDLGLVVDEIPGRWGSPASPDQLEARLRDDRDRRCRAVLLVHNETSTGVRSDVAAVRAAMDAAGHDALLIVDTVSSLASMDFRFDEWRVDVALTGSQKGLMLPPGLALLCIGPKAIRASEGGGSLRSFFDWRPILRDNAAGFYPYTPATLLLFGLREALDMLGEEGLESVFARHRRLAEGVRAAVRAWGLDLLCDDPRAYSDSLTAVVTGEGIDSEAVIRRARERFDLSLGVGLGKLKGRVFRIGHLGALNELEALATIAGAELALAECGVAVELGSGARACERAFAEVARSSDLPIPSTV